MLPAIAHQRTALAEAVKAGVFLAGELAAGPTALELQGAHRQAREAEADAILSALREPGLQDIRSPQAAHGGLVAHVLEAGEGEAARPFVWVQDARAAREHGRPLARGLAALGIDPSRVLRVTAGRARDALWVMEETVKAGLDVVGEIEGDPKALDFTATRRLAMFARASARRCLLMRTGQEIGPRIDPAPAGIADPTVAVVRSSAAPWRWVCTSLSATPDPFDARAPGAARWALSLSRARTRPPGDWVIEWVPPAHRREDDEEMTRRPCLRIGSGRRAGLEASDGTGPQTYNEAVPQTCNEAVPRGFDGVAPAVLPFPARRPRRVA